jgi:hypothetical protein
MNKQCHTKETQKFPHPPLKTSGVCFISIIELLNNEGLAFFSNTVQA